MILSSTGKEKLLQRDREGEGGGLRSFTEACLRVVVVFGRLKQHQNCSISQTPYLQPALRSTEVRQRYCQ